MKLIAIVAVLAALVGPATAQYQFGRATFYGTDGCKLIRGRGRGLGREGFTRRAGGRGDLPLSVCPKKKNSVPFPKKLTQPSFLPDLATLHDRRGHPPG